MSDFAAEMKARTARFGVRVYRVVESLEGPSARVLGKQLLRCGTSVGANYRAACRARSPAEFRAKLGIVEEECDETFYWLEMLVETGVVSADRLSGLIDEANELLAIVVTSINTSKRNG
ncbi:MAG: four helix bundle protein [Planctomycetota bacterium]